MAIARYGEEQLRADIKVVFSELKNSVSVAAGADGGDKNFLRKTLNPSAGSNPVKEPFYSLFMAFYELIIRDSKEPFAHVDIFRSAHDLAGKIKTSASIRQDYRINNINLTKGLIQNHFKESKSTIRSSGSAAIDLENYLRRSRIEAANYDFKQGFYTLSETKRTFDENNFDKILQNIAAISNLGKGKKGYLFIGVTDDEKDTKRIEQLDGITAFRFPPFGIVGLEREAKIRGVSLDDYILFITRSIRDSALPEDLKTRVNTSATPITYRGNTVLMLEIKAGDEPVWYNNKLYIRDGHEKVAQEVTGQQIQAVYKLFA
jgi:hypothetical protein